MVGTVLTSVAFANRISDQGCDPQKRAKQSTCTTEESADKEYDEGHHEGYKCTYTYYSDDKTWIVEWFHK